MATEIYDDKKVDKILHIFFFQAEDGIRDYDVTGVQTCALPIYLFIVQRIIESRVKRCFKTVSLLPAHSSSFLNPLIKLLFIIL